MGEVALRIEVTVRPTEDEAKVAEAVHNVFGDIALKQRSVGGAVFLQYEGRAASALGKFKALLERERIRDAAQNLLVRRVRGNQVSFALNKQAAFAGHISFYTDGESPLGGIEVTLSSQDPQETIRWLTQRQ